MANAISILVFVRDALIALALSWVGISLGAGHQEHRPSEPCAANSVNCTPQN